MGEKKRHKSHAVYRVGVEDHRDAMSRESFVGNLAVEHLCDRLEDFGAARGNTQLSREDAVKEYMLWVFLSGRCDPASSSFHTGRPEDAVVAHQPFRRLTYGN